MESCVLIMENKRDKIPSGSNYVRFIKNGFLYIENGASVIKVKNTFGKDDIDYVYIRKTENGYEESLKPFDRTVEVVEEQPKKIQKRNYKRKK